MMLAQAFRRLLHGIRQSLTGLSLNTPLSNLSHPQPPVKPPRRTQPRTKNSRHLRLGTFNVQSIGSQRKQHETLPRDLSAYKVDILGIQETRITFQSEQKTGTYHLLTLPCSNRRQGLGFAISPHLRRFLHKYWAQSDRVGVLQLRLPKAQRVNIVNAYSPHSGYPVTAIDSFYADLNTALSKLPQRDTTIILGDFNAKIGQRRENESFLGKWSRGRRNRNGHILASFCDANDLFITNTAFRKRARNITTWTLRLKDHCIFNQIDYIICSQRTKKLCCNAQSWGGTLTPSDHKLVTLDFDLRALRGLRRRQEQAHSSEAETRLATHLLVRDSKYRAMYRQLLEKNLADLPDHRATTNQHWTTTLNSAIEAAADSVGYMPLINHTKVTDPELSRLSYEQRQLRQLIYNDHKQDVKALRVKRNRLLHQIRERSKALAGALIDEKLAIIEQSNRSTQVFEATRALFRRRSPLTSLCDSTGKYILGRQEAGAKIKQHFQEQFSDPTRTPVAADDLPRPLNNPITASELDRAFRRLRNGRATGPDSIPAELLKYGSDLLAQPLADIINHGLTTGDNIHLGDGILLGLPKPNKPAGQCASLRPIVLLNSIRKAFSLVVLRRISPKVERFLSPHQSGFRPCRSTADAVWAHRWIAARAQRYKDRFHILGIDLSRAFDTVNRDKLLSVLKPLLDDDELRLIRLLLRDTMLSLRLGNRLLSPFESNTGTPQGDSLSPVLFVVYLEAALRDLASQLDVPHDLLADMIVYADDADFVCQSAEIATQIETEAPAVLAKWSLQMNTSKTEHTIVHRSPTAQSNRITRAKDEDWRITRKLGSLLGDAEDVSRRKNLATAALHRMWKIWLRPSKTSETTRLRLYNCYVLPILLYNCGTWALTDSELHNLESFHRQQLRKVIGVRYPDTISNDKLYDRTKTQPLRFHLLHSRWSLFGHILRRPAGIPAYRFMAAFFNPNTTGKWRGRHRLTLPTVLDADLQTLSAGHRLQCAPDLYLLRLCAQDRAAWRDLTEALIACAPLNGLWSREERNVENER